MLGLFEPRAATWNLDSIRADFCFGEIDPDWDRMTPHLELAYSRVPSTINHGIRKFFCGPESFAPHLAPLVGETPELRNCYVAAGLNSLGILNGAGIGNVLAHWIVDGLRRLMSLQSMSIASPSVNIQPPFVATARQNYWDVYSASITTTMRRRQRAMSSARCCMIA
jgi:hypothetical protein